MVAGFRGFKGRKPECSWSLSLAALLPGLCLTASSYCTPIVRYCLQTGTPEDTTHLSHDGPCSAILNSARSTSTPPPAPRRAATRHDDLSWYTRFSPRGWSARRRGGEAPVCPLFSDELQCLRPARVSGSALPPCVPCPGLNPSSHSVDAPPTQHAQHPHPGEEPRRDRASCESAVRPSSLLLVTELPPDSESASPSR